MEYNVDYYIEKYEAIPDEEWCVGAYEGPNESHCALGFCGVNYGNQFMGTLESNILSRIIRKVTNETVDRLNDGADWRYQQATPKQRILAALYDVKKVQNEIEPNRP